MAQTNIESVYYYCNIVIINNSTPEDLDWVLHNSTHVHCCCCGCCCCLHIKSRSDLYSVLSNIRTGPTDADAFRGHRLTTQKGLKKIKNK